MSQILFKTLEQEVVSYPEKGVIRISINFQSIIRFSTALLLTAIFFYFDPMHLLINLPDSATQAPNFHLYLALFISAPALTLLVNSIRESLVRYPISVDATRGALIAGRRLYSFSEIDDISVVSGRFSTSRRFYSLVLRTGEKEIPVCSSFGDEKLQALSDLGRRIEETVYMGRSREGIAVRDGADTSFEELRLHFFSSIFGSLLSIVAWIFFPEYQITHLNSDSGISIWYLGVCIIYAGFLHAMGYPVIDKMNSKNNSERFAALFIFLLPVGLYFIL